MSPLTVGIAESAWFDRLTKSVEPEGIDSLAQDRPVEGCALRRKTSCLFSTLS